MVVAKSKEAEEEQKRLHAAEKAMSDTSGGPVLCAACTPAKPAHAASAAHAHSSHSRSHSSSGSSSKKK